MVYFLKLQNKDFIFYKGSLTPYISFFNLFPVILRYHPLPKDRGIHALFIRVKKT